MQIVRNPLIYFAAFVFLNLLGNNTGLAQSSESKVTKRTRYRFVDTTPKRDPKTADISAASLQTQTMSTQVADLAPPEVKKTAFHSEGSPKREIISAIPASSRQIRHVMEPQQQLYSDYDDARSRYERLQAEKSLAPLSNPNLVRVVPQATYQVFPIGSDLQGHNTNLLDCEPECCDEWAGLCRMKNLGYKCGCGGLKANPGHYGQKWLRGCDNCETTCGCKRSGGKGISSRCGKSCLNKSADRAKTRINNRDNCGCKDCSTLDRGSNCNTCNSMTMAPTLASVAFSNATCDCEFCQLKARHRQPSKKATLASSAAAEVSRGFTTLKDAISSRAIQNTGKADIGRSTRAANWQDILR